MTEAHDAVSHEDWIEARKRFLEKEKEFTRLRDELSRERRSPPPSSGSSRSLVSRVVTRSPGTAEITRPPGSHCAA